MGEVPPIEFERRREGMTHALDGSLWLYRHVNNGEAMAHLVSSDKQLLLEIGQRLGMAPQWLQYKPLKDPRTAKRVDAWHWDLRGRFLEAASKLAEPKVKAGVSGTT